MKTAHAFKRAFLLLALMVLLSPNTYADKAINVQVVDITGKTLRLSDYRGKWVLMNFWAPFCPACRAEVQLLNALNRRKDFVVIGISLDYGPDRNVVPDMAKRTWATRIASAMSGEAGDVRR
jgi:thiol-disulfide isomerase/thioredoxin